MIGTPVNTWDLIIVKNFFFVGPSSSTRDSSYFRLGNSNVPQAYDTTRSAFNKPAPLQLTYREPSIRSTTRGTVTQVDDSPPYYESESGPSNPPNRRKPPASRTYGPKPSPVRTHTPTESSFSRSYSSHDTAGKISRTAQSQSSPANYLIRF